MKTVKKYIALLLLLFALLSALPGCQNVQSQILRSPALPDVVSDSVPIESFIKQSQNVERNLDGVIVSPYYEAEANGQTVYSYCVPVKNSETHSFGYLELTEDMFPVTVTIRAEAEISSAEIIPEKIAEEITVSGNSISFTVKKFDKYTVLFNGGLLNPYTLFVREYKEPEIPEGYQVIEYQSGIHYVDSIELTSNTVLYLHSGAYVVAKQPNAYLEAPVTSSDSFGMPVWNSFIYADTVSNIRIVGNGMIDFSGIDWHARNPISLINAENVVIEGITLVNAASWNINIRSSKNVTIRDVILFGYRQNSDGIAICDTENATVTDCWARSGDDLFEVKSVESTSKTGGKNIRFENCYAWADVSRNFGIIQETRNEISGVVFENCSALYNAAVWNAEMGVFLVVAGEPASVSNVTFRNCDSYYNLADGYVMNVSVGKNDWTETATGHATVNNVTFENMHFKVGKVRIRGAEAQDGGTKDDVDNITFRNIYIGGVLQTQQTLTVDYFGVVGDHISIE